MHTHIQVRGVRSTGSSSQLMGATDGKPAGSIATAVHTQARTHTLALDKCAVQGLRCEIDDERESR